MLGQVIKRVFFFDIVCIFWGFPSSVLCALSLPLQLSGQMDYDNYNLPDIINRFAFPAGEHKRDENNDI